MWKTFLLQENTAFTERNMGGDLPFSEISNKPKKSKILQFFKRKGALFSPLPISQN